MLEFGISSVRRTTDAVTMTIERVVTHRGEVSAQHYAMLLTLASGIVGRRFELKPTSARQAVEPVLRRLVRVVEAPAPITVRRGA